MLNFCVQFSIYHLALQNRASALILTPKEGTVLPPDARIRAEIGGRITYLLKSVDLFIIPLSLLREGTKTVSLTLESDLFPSGEKVYPFTVQWWISPSKAGKAPMAGDFALASDVTFTSPERKVFSLKAVGDDRLLTNRDALKLELRKKNLDDYIITATLRRKAEDGVYANTAWSHAVEAQNGTASLTVPLSTQKPGCFCLMLT